MDEYSKLISLNYDFEPVAATSRFFPEGGEEAGEFFVSAGWLRKHLEDVVVIEVLNEGDEKFSCRPLREYEGGHIPGALGMYRTELGPVKDYFRSDEELRELLASYGVTADSAVVFYSAYSRYGLYSASRAAFAAYYLGVRDVKILDGGWQAWERAGYEQESGHEQIVGEDSRDSVISFGETEFPERHDVLVSTPADVKSFIQEREDPVLVSIRSYKEYIGNNQGSSWNRGSGEIVGAVFGGDDKLLNEEGYLANPDAYLPDWADRGITADRSMLLYCGTSWRASTAFFILKELGWEQVYLFDGSWHKWHEAHEADPSGYPVQFGIPGSDDFQIIGE